MGKYDYITDLQKKIILCFDDEGYASCSSIRECLALLSCVRSKNWVSVMLNSLSKKGFVERVKGSRGVWKLKSDSMN